MKQRKEDMECIPLRVLEEEDPRLAIYRENADLRQEIARLNKLLNQAIKDANTDSLTGVFNRKGITEAFSQTVQTDKGAVIFIDLDKFKAINDTFGHEAGDRALKLVAEKLQSFARPHDIVARIGGDEYVMVFSNMDKDVAEARTQEIRNMFDTLTIKAVADDANSVIVRVGASVGMECFTENEVFESVKARADKKMYEIKKSKGPSGR